MEVTRSHVPRVTSFLASREKHGLRPPRIRLARQHAPGVGQVLPLGLHYRLTGVNPGATPLKQCGAEWAERSTRLRFLS
jgi:hypothetical protein